MSKQSDEPGGSQVDDLYSRLARDAARLLVVHEAGQILRSTTDPKELAGGLLANIAEAVFSGSGCVARVQDELAPHTWSARTFAPSTGHWRVSTTCVVPTPMTTRRTQVPAAVDAAMD